MRLVDISRQAVGDSCLIAGDLTTTGKQELPYEELLGAYREQIEALMEQEQTCWWQKPCWE